MHGKECYMLSRCLCRSHFGVNDVNHGVHSAPAQRGEE